MVRPTVSPAPASPLQLGLWNVIARGDGQYLFTPRKPSLECSVPEAAAYLGISDETLRSQLELVDEEGRPIFEVSRPSPRKTRLTWESVERHKIASQDPEYWDRIRRKNHRAALFLKF